MSGRSLVLAGIGLASLGLASCGRGGTRDALSAARALEQREAAARGIDPALVAYAPVLEIATGLAKPAAVAVAEDGRVFVAGDREVRVFGPDGAPQPGFALSEEPRCLAVDDSGALWIGYGARVRLHDPSGVVQTEWPVEGKHPVVTCVTPSGQDVWVADAGDRVVLRYNRSGQLQGRLGEKDPARKVPGLIIPSYHLDVLVDAQGQLLVNNPGRLTVETYKPEGAFVSAIGKAAMAIDGFCGCCNPTDMALLPDGRLVTSEKGVPRVKVLERDGRLSCVVAGPDDLSVSAASGLDLAVDGQGRVIVLDPHARLVRVFAPKETVQ